MFKKKVLNTSEFKTFDALNRSLANSGYYALSQVRVRDVITGEFEGDAGLSKRDRQSLMDSTFDFVVLNNEGFAEFVVEFDGPCHETEKQRDIRKNRICHKTVIPLWRITDIELKEQDKISILSFIVMRFLTHKREFQSIQNEIQEYVQTLSPSELARLTEGGFADPSIDPSFEFDFRHPFPGTLQTA